MMIMILLINFIFLLKIWVKQNISILQKLQKTGLEQQQDPKAFVEYSNNIQDIYKNVKKYNPCRKVLIVFDDMVGNIISIKKT